MEAGRIPVARDSPRGKRGDTTLQLHSHSRNVLDAFLANDRTLTDPDVVRVERSGRVRLRIINGASSSQFWIDLGTLTGNVLAVDGHSVRPVAGQRFPMAMAQRLDLLIDLPRTGA